MKFLTLLVLCLPLFAFAAESSEHGGQPAEHGGAPAEEKAADQGASEHGGAPAEEKKEEKK